MLAITPGLFDSTLDFDFIGKEIVNCINMAKDGIHAFLNQIKELEEQEISIHEKKFKRVYDMNESKLNKTTSQLEPTIGRRNKLLRVKAEKNAEASSKKEAEAAKRKLRPS
ncbi:immune-associated nucleotide-binding protein 9-like protein [Tanacetum coccineum]